MVSENEMKSKRIQKLWAIVRGSIKFLEFMKSETIKSQTFRQNGTDMNVMSDLPKEKPVVNQWKCLVSHNSMFFIFWETLYLVSTLYLLVKVPILLSSNQIDHFIIVNSDFKLLNITLVIQILDISV
jgi:hypothetical protein